MEDLELSPQQMFVNYQLAKSGAKHLAKFTKIRDENDSRVLDFQLWDWQEEALDEMRQVKYLIVLKARQLGWSWIAALDVAHLAIFSPGSNILLLSQGQDEAQKFLDKVWFLIANLPAYLRPAVIKHNEREIVLGFDFDKELGEYKVKSTVQALPSTEGAGRSQTATLVVADEWAFHPYAEKNFAAIQPTIDNGSARFLAISTANGTGNFYATNYKLAQRGEGMFTRRFYPYWMRPGRDEEWYETTKAQYKASPLLFHQEFPRDEDEAFIASGGCIYNTETLRRMEEKVRDPLDWQVIQNPTLQALARDHEVKVWKEFNPAHTYVMWTDPATGEFGDDFFCTRIFNTRTGEDVAAWWGKKDENYVGWISCELGRVYGYAFYGIERNGVGQSILNVVLNYLSYPRNRIYHHRDLNAAKSKQTKAPGPGFPASRVGNQMMESLSKAKVANDELTVYDRDLLHEMRTFVEDPETKKVGAKKPDHDDRVRALLGCLYLSELPEAQVRYRLPVSPPKPESRIGQRRRVMV